MDSSLNKRVHLIRHAEAQHNVSGRYDIQDPPLTPLGLRQAAEIPRTALPARNAEIVVASPLRRTLQTATLGFPDHAKRQGGIIALAELQEAGPHPCDHGSERIADDFPHVDFQHLPPGWTVKEGRFEPSHEALTARARYTRRWLRARPESEIAVVSHWGFLFYVSDSDPLAHLSDGWNNTECRTFTFKSTDDDEATLELLRDTETPSASQSSSKPLPHQQGLPSLKM